MEGDGDDHQEDLCPGVQLISVGDVLLLQPGKLVCQKGSGALRVRIGAEVRVAKYQIFYTDQFSRNEFTPRKSAYIKTNCRPKMHEMGKESKF